MMAALAIFAGEVLAEEEEDSFQRAVSLKRHRKGSPQWNTQELIASGMTALHEEHLEILRELESLKREIHQLKEKE